MEDTEKYSWFAELPTEILITILDFLDRFQLVYLMRVNKRIHGIAQYVLENRKKIRLCGENLSVLVLSPPSMLDYLALENNEVASRASLLINTLIDEAPTKKFVRNWNRVKARARTTVKTLNNNKKITMIEAPVQEHLRRMLFINAIAADLCLLIVDPQEIDEYAEYIKDTIFGCCFMMSARNVIVAIDLHKYALLNEQPLGLQKMYNEAKTKMVKLLNRTVGMCYAIVPIDVRTGGNIASGIAHKFTWFNGPSVQKLLVADQLRTNFDETAYKELCEVPFRFQMIIHHDIFRVGTVLEGRVMSGTLKPFDQVCIHPGGIVSEVRKNMESYYSVKSEAKPGDIVAFHVKNVGMRDLERRFTYVVKSNETQDVTCTLAFRAQIAVMKSDRFTQHQIYHVFYGRAHIKCLLWWIFPTDGKNHDRAERKLKAKGQLRPPKPTFKKATAIFLPLIHYDIETYKPSVFEKNYRGKVMMMEKTSIVGVGRVDRVISVTAATFNITTSADYQQQYATVVDQASSLFNLPTEQKQLELFLDHVTTNEHAKKSILRVKMT